MNNDYTKPMQHKYAVGDKVRVTKHKTLSGEEGEIITTMPYTFIEPAYYVRIGASIVAMSERSLEKIEVQDSETGQNADI